MCRFLCICLLFAGLMGFFCSPILLCQVSSRMGEGCMFATCCQGALIGLRIKLRTQQNIQVNQCVMMLFTHSVNFPWRLSSSNFCVVTCVSNSESKYKMRLSAILLQLFVFQFLESLQFVFVCLVKDSNLCQLIGLRLFAFLGYPVQWLLFGILLRALCVVPVVTWAGPMPSELIPLGKWPCKFNLTLLRKDLH